MGARKYVHHDSTGDFDLDLAPLLAVIMKLVPVMLLSSAFVQLMVVETELPQVVQEAIKQNELNPNAARIRFEVETTSGVRIVIDRGGRETEILVPPNDGAIDLPTLHSKLVEVKKAHPDVFKADLRPGPGVEYGVLIKIMDEARRARDRGTTFPVKDIQTGTETRTPYMFPEIVFANTLEG